MNENTYEYACMRAELLGHDKPDKELFQAKQKERLDKEIEESKIQELEKGGCIDDKIHGIQGGFSELNTVLASTQSKINKFKGACGSLTNLIREKLGGSKGDLSYSTAPSYVEQPGFSSAGPSRSTAPEEPKGDINSALDDLDRIKDTQRASDLDITKDMAKDVKKQVGSQLDKLDAMINAADRAELSMAHQNKQMKKFIR